jgi:hypothetical protein
MTGTYLLDYGAGNVRSLVNAVKKLGHDITYVKDPSDILKADVTSLPFLLFFSFLFLGRSYHIHLRLIFPL